MKYFLFILGFILLVKGADYLVAGSSALAKRFGVSSLVVGLTVVAFGTSLPEMIVNVISVLKGNTDISLGNIIGSNISNILLILGLTAAIFPLKVKKSTAWKEIPFSLFAIGILYVLANDRWIDGSKESILTRSDGIVMLAFFGIFMYYLFEMAKKSYEEVPLNGEKAAPKEDQVPIWKIALMIGGGLVGLYFGGEFVVDGAVYIAKKFGMSDFLISATIIAIGTSLPELVTSLTAAFKKEPDISVGNIIGSNIFNIFLVLGVTSVIKPISVTIGINIDIIFMMVATVYLFLFLFIGKKYEVERWQGIFLTVMYVFYIAYIIMRG